MRVRAMFDGPYANIDSFDAERKPTLLRNAVDRLAILAVCAAQPAAKHHPELLIDYLV